MQGVMVLALLVLHLMLAGALAVVAVPEPASFTQTF